MSAVAESSNHTTTPSNVLLPEKHPDSRKIIREFKDPFGRSETPWQPGRRCLMFCKLMVALRKTSRPPRAHARSPFFGTKLRILS
ncbi:hypothetical protein K439DRAFT_417480 [Ramaria rubella]|nr:hypothetical protein K439DRAFT_417480 [Ramaria rubella]